MFKKTNFSNGLRIITIPQKNTQAATVLVLIGAGSKYETKETNGISHFLEHMFFKGTKRYPNATKLIESLDRIGGIYNAFTDKEYTGIWAKTDFKYIDLSLSWISDIYLNSLLNEEEIEKEKKVIIEEINMRFDNPLTYIGGLWSQLLYGNQPAGWDVLGTKENILNIKKKQILDYFKNHYSSKNTIVCLAGNIDSGSVILKIKKYFKKINTGFLKPKLKTIEKQDRPRVLVYFKKTDQTNLCLGVRGYDVFHTERYGQDLISAILGEMMSSRLWVSIREKNCLAYYVQTSSDNETDVGHLVTQTGVDHQNIEKAINLILKEYKSLKEKRIGKKELQKVKDNIKGKMALTLEMSDARSFFYGIQELLEGKTLTPNQIYDKIDSVRADDVLKICREIFKPEKLNLALIGPFKNKSGFQKLLKI